MSANRESIKPCHTICPRRSRQNSNCKRPEKPTSFGLCQNEKSLILGSVLGDTSITLFAIDAVHMCACVYGYLLCCWKETTAYVSNLRTHIC